MSPINFITRAMSLALLLGASSTIVCAQQGATAPAGVVTVDSCRALALANNKQLKISRAKVDMAGYEKDAAFAAYLPSIDFAGGYMYNQKNLSVFDSDQLLPVKSFDPKTQSYQFNLVTNPETGMPVKGPNGQYIPGEVALIPKESMEFDIHNLFFGAVTVTQPIYMGGKIVALNKMAGYAKDLASAMSDNKTQDIIYAVDASYWQVVSLKAKRELAVSYVALLDTLMNNVQAMVDEGVATESDLLTVKVKLNEANVDLTKVENGLVLSRMALAQICGLPVNTQMILADESIDEASVTPVVATSYNMEDVYSRRKDLEALRLGVKIMEQKADVARSTMMPSVALMGSYSFSNPNMFDGFKKRFDGAFSVGAVLRIPIFNYSNYNQYRAAKTQAVIQELELEDAREMVDLQVSQASFKSREAVKTYQMALSNMTSAESNLSHAQIGFAEGVMTTQNVMEAQTAWLKANSEKIDAMIDVKLCDVYLSKVLGTLNY